MRRKLLVLAAIAAGSVLASAGCSALGLGGASGGGSSSSSGGSSGGKPLQLPEKTVYQGGLGVSPTPEYLTGSPLRTPLGALPSLPSTNPSATYAISPIASPCAGHYKQGVRNGLDVTSSGGTATVSWWEIGDPALQGYQLATVSQDFVYGMQPAWKWQVVAQANACRKIQATVAGLKVGGHYVFVLHAVIKNYEDVPPIIPEIGRSSAVTIA
jgi:hypothetical protein